MEQKWLVKSLEIWNKKCGQLSSTRYDLLQNTNKCNIKVRFDVLPVQCNKMSNEDLKVLMLVGKMLCIDMS